MEKNSNEKGDIVAAEIPDVKVVSDNDPSNSQPLIENKQVQTIFIRTSC